MTFNTHHILNIYRWNSSQTCVGGRCVVVALLAQIIKLLKRSQDNGFKICELI